MSVFYQENIGFYIRGGIRNPTRSLLLEFDEKNVELRVVKDQNLSSNYFHASNHFSMTISQRISLPEMQITPNCNTDSWPFGSNNRKKRGVKQEVKHRLEKNNISHEKDTSPAVLDFISSSPKNFKIETAENHKNDEKQHHARILQYFSPHTRLMHDNII